MDARSESGEMNTSRYVRYFIAAHAGYFLLGGLWPLINMSSFEAITGHKVDEFLVRAVAGILVWASVVLFAQAARKRFPASTGAMAMGISLVLGLVGMIGAANGTLRWVYFLDGGIHLCFAAVWAWVLVVKGEVRA